MKFSVTILGSSSAMPTSKRFPTAHLLNVNERFYLIDCGEGTQIQLRKFHLPVARINHIFISHIHGDHVFGLYGLFSTFQLLGRKNDLHVFGPGELNELVNFYIRYFGNQQSYKIIVHSVGYSRKMLIYEDARIEVFSFPLEHRIPSCGFLFREKKSELNLRKESIDKYRPGIENIHKIKKGEDYITPEGNRIPNAELTLPAWKSRSYAYCSDTAYSTSLPEIVKNVDLLYHEATFSSEDKELATKTMHSTAEQAAMIASEAAVSKLLIGHFSSRYKSPDLLQDEARMVFGNTFAVNDGDIFEVERIRIPLSF